MINIFLLNLLVLFSSFIATIMGFGLGTIMLSTLSLFYPIRDIFLFVAILHAWHALWKLVLFRKELPVPLFVSFAVPGIAGAFFSATLLVYSPAHLAQKLLGVFIILYSTFIIYKPSFQFQPTQLTAMIGGLLSGILAGYFGIRGAITALFLSAYNLPNPTYIAMTGAIALSIDIVRLASYFWYGMNINPWFIYNLLLAIPLSFIGVLAARPFIYWIPRAIFRNIIAICLMLIGLKIASGL